MIIKMVIITAVMKMVRMMIAVIIEITKITQSEDEY